MLTSNPIFETHDYIIGGKMVVGKTVLTDEYQVLMNTDNEARLRVKKELIHQMAEFMLENNLVEFTQYKDPVLFHTHIAVRAYLAPNDQVKILRLANKVV
jgi:hypothetical protein